MAAAAGRRRGQQGGGWQGFKPQPELGDFPFQRTHQLFAMLGGQIGMRLQRAPQISVLSGT